MNTEPKFNYLSKSLEDTAKLGELIAKNSQPPILIELVGDLGGGKTALVKAIAKALGINQTVTSPTFNIHRSYQSPNGVVLEHFDFYRLEDDEIVKNELLDSLSDPSTIVCVEWAQNFSSHLFADRLSINCHFIDESKRRYELSAAGKKALNILEQIQK